MCLTVGQVSMETHKRALARNVLLIARLVSMATKTTSVRVAILHSILKVKKSAMRCDGKITWAIEMEEELRHFSSKSVIKKN